MKITVCSKFDEKSEALVLGLFEEDKDHYDFLSEELSKELDESIKNKKFAKKFGEKFSTRIHSLPYERVYVYGLGKKEEFCLHHVRRILGKIVKCTKSKKQESFTTDILEKVCSLKLDYELLGRATAESLLLANYNFIKYLDKEKQDKKKPVKFASILWTKNSADFNKGLKVGGIIADSTNFARDLVNEPANVVNSEYIEREAKKLASSTLKVKVLNKSELEKLGMNALLGVNAGSDIPPKLIIMEYNGGSGKRTAFVGKGITFDSGGYNLKPTKYIEDMKSDMGGAAAVIGTMRAASHLGLKKNLIGVMPLCENMVNGKAQKPGDIVKAYNGKTIEIGNTDAEGRLILADALAYVEDKYEPEIMVDLATLTGSCVFALGYYAAAIIGKDEKLILELKEAGCQSDDKVWQLPFFDEYQDWMDGDISDLNNIATKGRGYEAGSVTAGVFLSKFVDKARWAHIDIAGSAFWGVDGDYLKKGATGSGVRVLTYWLLNN